MVLHKLDSSISCERLFNFVCVLFCKCKYAYRLNPPYFSQCSKALAVVNFMSNISLLTARQSAHSFDCVHARAIFRCEHHHHHLRILGFPLSLKMKLMKIYAHTRPKQCERKSLQSVYYASMGNTHKKCCVVTTLATVRLFCLLSFATHIQTIRFT